MSVARDIEKYKLNIITRVLYYNGSSIRNLCMVSNKTSNGINRIRIIINI